jgi:hypothetical protein
MVRVGSIALLGAVAAGAFGQELTLQGFASGTFVSTGTAVDQGLTYSGSTFSAGTAGGFYALGGNPTPGSNFNNLGSFSLTGNPASYFGDKFTLDVTFTAPTGITNGTSNTYTATLLGQVSSNNNGGVLVSFGSSPKIFTFANATSTGSFDLNVNTVSINPAKTASVTGYGLASVSPVPEPESMFCLATGLVGVVLKRKKK